MRRLAASDSSQHCGGVEGHAAPESSRRDAGPPTTALVCCTENPSRCRIRPAVLSHISSSRRESRRRSHARSSPEGEARDREPAPPHLKRYGRRRQKMRSLRRGRPRGAGMRGLLQGHLRRVSARRRGPLALLLDVSGLDGGRPVEEAREGEEAPVIPGHVEIIVGPNFEHPLVGPEGLRELTSRCNSCGAVAKFRSRAILADCRDCGGSGTMRGVVDVRVWTLTLVSHN